MSLHLETTTAADLLSFQSFTDNNGVNRLTRVAQTAEQWSVSDWDGETYFIKFNGNFSKKHLATFSKDEHRTREAAYYRWQNTGQAAGDNWKEGEHQLMKEKMKTTVDNRAVANICTCGHTYNQHPANPAGLRPCPLCAPGACTDFITPFGANRKAAHKPIINPLAGVATSTVTFIVLNWVPKGEFESILAQSIQAHEKPPGWSIGQPLAVAVGQQAVLRWDFGAHRRGAVVKVQKQAGGGYQWHEFQGCYVKAKKTATAWKQQTWEIFHMETGTAAGTNAPF